MKEKKVSQSATKIRIISCTAAPCAPFRPQCAHSRPRLRSLSSPRVAPHPANAPLRRPPRRAISPRPCTLRPSPCEKLAVFRFSPPLFREKPTFLKNAPAFCSLPSPTGSSPRPRRRGKISHRRGESAQKCARVHFFLFLLAFYAGKTRYICIENLFYQLRMAKARPFVPVFRLPAGVP